LNKTIITTFLIFTVGFANAQSKKDQIVTLNYKQDSLNIVIQNDRLVSRRNSDSLNTKHVADKEKLKIEINAINDSINSYKNEINIISAELTVLGDSITLQKNIATV
jgi:hypothetical protein